MIFSARESSSPHPKNLSGYRPENFPAHITFLLKNFLQVFIFW